MYLLYKYILFLTLSVSHINTSVGFNMFSNRRSFINKVAMMSQYKDVQNFFVPNININDSEYSLLKSNLVNLNESEMENTDETEYEVEKKIIKKNQQFKNNIFKQT